MTILVGDGLERQSGESITPTRRRSVGEVACRRQAQRGEADDQRCTHEQRNSCAHGSAAALVLEALPRHALTASSSVQVVADALDMDAASRFRRKSRARCARLLAIATLIPSAAPIS